ncbi:MAG: DinB family protein [Janthinobacterium lividum]
MRSTEAIAQHVLDVHEGNNWTEVDLAHTLRDITLLEATTQTAASPNTIAALVRHLAYWNRVMARRAQGQATEIGPDNGFNGPGLAKEVAWQALCTDLLHSGHELAAAVRSFPEARLAEPILPKYSSAYKNLQGAVEHLHYHLGQIVVLKNLVRRQALPNG